MRRDTLSSLALVSSSVACGMMAWSGITLALPLAVAFPAFWSLAPNRLTAAMVSAGYFLAASHGLPQGVATYFRADLWLGLALWLIASSAFVLVHALLWSSGTGWASGARYVLAMLITALPPIGILGWAHPITAAGILFPGLGWIGLTAMAAGLALMATRYRPAAIVAFASLWIWSAACGKTANLGHEWLGVDLKLGKALGRNGSLQWHRDLFTRVNSVREPGYRVVVLPESALGLWTPTVERLWREQLRGLDTTVIAGAAIVNADGYDNVMVSVSATDARIIYRERMPVPVSMWRPWANWAGQQDGARAVMFGTPVVEIAGSRIAPLICYEQLLVWPLLQSMLHSPDRIVLIGNGWWTEGTNIVAIQRSSAEAWSRLFAVPVTISFNR
ncbi:conjugal transfer protein TraB [Rhizobium sp. G187]|uniref:conjugal transfer protein TraB n=1 Tax=Rhizobium sp. G187 TaxID=3451352 RepID=UPI003EE7F9BA